MWLHIVIFIVTVGVFAAWKAGWLKLEGLENTRVRKLFLLVAVGGNLLGLVVTLGNGAAEIYTEGHRLRKEENGSYEQEFLVSVNGENTGSIYVQIPEKETGEEVQEDKPITPEEEQERLLQEALSQYNQEKNDPEYYYLPAVWDGNVFIWEEPGEQSGTLLAALSLFAAFVLLVKQARERQEAWMKRSEQLLMDYPGFIMKFTLLVQAGMTVRKTFQKMAMDYRRKKPEKPRFAYEELVTACYEMESGVSEAEVYRRFGERCGQIKYKTFSTLLIQNLQKGSRKMSEMLERESMEAWDERKRKARVLGEAAATKLLFPMVLMLVVVMAIIMIPAFLSFYG